MQALDVLRNDKETEVSEMAFDCDERSNIKYKESDAEYKLKKDQE